MDRTEALALLQQYNKEPFHIQHALTVEAVMGYFAEKLGYGNEKAFWETAGLLHDLDFEQYSGRALHQGNGDYAGAGTGSPADSCRGQSRIRALL